jgi:hypothetical protein
MERPNCPLLMPGLTGSAVSFSVPVYCRTPNGRVRVPSRGELLSLCSVGQYLDCPGYLRWEPELRAAGTAP